MVSEGRTRIIFKRIDEVASKRRQYLDMLREIFNEIVTERTEVMNKKLPPEIVSAIEKYRRDIEKRLG